MHSLAILSAALLAHSGSPHTPAATLAITHAHIEVGDGRVIDDGTIVVSGDRIVSVGHDAPPTDATVFDASGLTVYPGFIDAYSTNGLKLPDALPSGKNPPDTRTTAPATMWHENRKGIRSDLQASKLLDLKGPFNERYKQGVTTVLLSSGSGAIAGTASLVDLSDTPKVVLAEAGEEIMFRNSGGFRGGSTASDDANLGAGQRGQQAQGDNSYAYPGTLFGVFGLMRQTLSDAQYYARQDKPKADPTLEGLRPLVTGRMPAIFTINNAREIARAGHICDEFGLRMIVNGAADAYRLADVLVAHKAAAIVSVDLPEEPTKTPQSDRDATPKAVLEDRWNVWKERTGNEATLAAAGVPLALRGGTSMAGYLGGVRKLIAAGLPREAALKAMTSGAAQIFGVSDRLGTIEPGKLANLTIMSGDFASDKSTVRAVVAEGVRKDVSKEGSK